MKIPRMFHCRSFSQGFTLIELSIVLVIIGLIVGGVLVGQDLIRAATVRAQISQIEKYNQAVNTFRGKYGYLPGDIKDPEASSFGFLTRGTNPGQGDGNNVIEGNTNGLPATNGGYFTFIGESGMVWVDLSAAHLINETFTTITPTTLTIGITTLADPYMPAAKIGRGNYVYVYSGGYSQYDGQNYFGISAVTQLGSAGWKIASSPAMTVQEAFAIDAKVDDGLPQTGRVLAMYYNNAGAISYYPWWAAGGGLMGANNGAYQPTTAATSYATTDCYDNGNTAGPQAYAVAQNAALINCALSFKFQ